MHQLTHHGSRLSSHAPDRGGRKGSEHGQYEQSKSRRGPVRRPQTARTRLDSTEFVDCLESFEVHCLCQPINSNGQYSRYLKCLGIKTAPSHNCHRPTVISVISVITRTEVHRRSSPLPASIAESYWHAVPWGVMPLGLEYQISGTSVANAARSPIANAMLP
ncbi:hypothetical protein N431DRAFT_237501 [Stipitochalara longipes BDJ]|nr:hypothetical protein N431DRAFT_237501 [Stipitochalara longipes BDJ]